MSTISALIFAAATASATPAPQTLTMQQEFDTASAAAGAGDCRKAVPLFEALERRPSVKPGSLSGSAVSVRKGQCLVLQGRYAEGETAILAGLPVLERAGADFVFDVASANRSLGDAALSRADFGSAKERYQRARAAKIPELELFLIAGLIKSYSFDPGQEALAYADEGVRLATAAQPGSKDLQATFLTLKGRVLLNRGETAAAFDELKKALDLSGGLTMRTTLSEASMRGDLALAAMLLDRKADARKYLAYTGAGRITTSPFATAVSMSPPECGEETGLRPEDFAVVEFGIADDGSVLTAQTVYSRGGPNVAAAFSRAVSDWYWLPEALAKIPAFYRVATRVELRCTVAGGPSPSVIKPLTDRFRQWAAPRIGLTNLSDQTATIAELRGKTSDFGTNDPASTIAAVGMLAAMDPRTNAETVMMLDRAISAANGAPVPTEALNTLRILRLLSTPFAKIRGSNARAGRFDKRSITVLLQDPSVASDALAADTLRLLADSKEVDLLVEVAHDKRLPDHHPLRQLAFLMLANKAAASGDLAGAQQMFAQSGLTEQQCALIGPKPAMRRSGADSSDFPDEAAMYGFEGWVRLEFDITADGKTANARPVIAYPPFVFVNAAKGMTSGIRYAPSFRPTGGVACSANVETIKFIMQGLP